MKEIKKLREKLESYAKENNFKLNPEQKIVRTTLSGLLKNKREKGEIYCPCRITTRNKEKDKSIICPCVFHKQEIQETGHCQCNLFVGL